MRCGGAREGTACDLRQTVRQRMRPTEGARDRRQQDPRAGQGTKMKLARPLQHKAGHTSMRRIKPAWLPIAFALLLTGTGIGPVSALDFRCVEPSRYKNLLPVFSDDPN